LESIGTLLKKCREKKDLTIKDVENAIKIRTKYIQAIEQDDFDVIPGEVYIKGFIRSYAKYLGLDDSLLVQHYKEMKQREAGLELQTENPAIQSGNKETDKISYYQERRKERQQLSQKTKRQRILLVVVAILLIALILIVPSIWKTIQKRGEQNQSPISQQQENIVNNNDSSSQQPPLQSSPQSSFELVEENEKTKRYSVYKDNPEIIISAKERPCWYQASQKGETISSGTIKPYKEVYLRLTEEIKLQLGDPGAVEISIGDENIGIPGKDGIPITLFFSKK
jgi:cytoskeletal protein RodZ